MSDPSGCSQITRSLRLRIVPGTEQIRVIRGIRVQGFVVLVFRCSAALVSAILVSAILVSAILVSAVLKSSVTLLADPAKPAPGKSALVRPRPSTAPLWMTTLAITNSDSVH